MLWLLKIPKTESHEISLWRSSWEEMDKAFTNFRRDLEKSFSSFPTIFMSRFPNMQETSCDIIDEGKQFRVKMNVPWIRKKDIKIM